MDWSLVLVSQGIESTIHHSEESGWGLILASRDYGPAIRVIRQYHLENPRWPWRQKVFGPGVLFDWASLAWAILIALFFWVQNAVADFRDAGLMDALAVSRGEWWRLFTAVFLHGDLAHLAANASVGFVLLGLAMGRYGTGVGLLAAYMAGAGGNIATWLLYAEGHRSLGASGMVMGALGLLAVQSLSDWRHHAQPFKSLVAGLVGGVMLFVLLGLAPGTDVVAHFGGFVSGILFGGLLLLLSREAGDAAANVLSGLAFALLVIVTWWLALHAG
jgi:rhomboid protease GluP